MWYLEGKMQRDHRGQGAAWPDEIPPLKHVGGLRNWVSCTDEGEVGHWDGCSEEAMLS
jgi:hypothetical protein